MEQMSAEKIFADRVLGKLFGFPQCCVDFYEKSDGIRLRRAPAFDGYRLCPACEGKSLEDVVNDLATRRICAEPFPFAPNEEDYEALLSDPRFHETEQAWLSANKARVVRSENDPFKTALMTFHDVLNELDNKVRQRMLEDPSRSAFFRAEKELAQAELTGQLLDQLHSSMRTRVLEQMQKVD